jgi:hypothetical protein
MNIFFKSIISIVILSLLISCDNKSKKEFLPPIFEKQVKLKHTVIQDTLLLRTTCQKIISFDKYIIINVLTDGKFLHIYDRHSGEYLGGYVTKGQGPGEIAKYHRFHHLPMLPHWQMMKTVEQLLPFV